MSDLDDKLREITLDPPEECMQIHKLSKTDIAQIKKAFEDTHGYPVLVYEKGMMTGQEWYDRFEKEIDRLGFKYNVKSINRNMVEKAARKAAGL